MNAAEARDREDFVVGIDPGYARVGFAVMSMRQKKVQLHTFGLWETSVQENHSHRLLRLRQYLINICQMYSIKTMAIEQLFFAKNQKTAIAVAEARGVLLVTAAEFGLEVYEFSPLEVKKAITGNGRANKQEMQTMIQMLLQLKEFPKQDDAADALAIGLTYLHSRPFLEASKKINIKK